MARAQAPPRERAPGLLSMVLTTIFSVAAPNLMVFAATLKDLKMSCRFAGPGARPFQLSSPLSAFPNFPCDASELQQNLHIVLGWLPQWWGLGLRRLFLDGPSHNEFTIFFWSVGLPLLLLMGLTAQWLGLMPGVKQAHIHLAYTLSLLCAADVAGVVNNCLTSSPPNDFRLPSPTFHGITYAAPFATSVGFLGLFKVR